MISKEERLQRAMKLYTIQDLEDRIATITKQLTWAHGELAWDLGFELEEYKEILQAKLAEAENRSDLHLHSIGY